MDINAHYLPEKKREQLEDRESSKLEQKLEDRESSTRDGSTALMTVEEHNKEFHETSHFYYM